MTTQVTQCPECHTSFRVTETQLTIANGAVRCGSCLHIFHAPDYWLESHADPSPATDTPPVSPTQMTANPATEDPFREQQLAIDESSEQHSLDSIFEDGDFDEDNYLDQLADHLSGNDQQRDNQTPGELTVDGEETATEHTVSEDATTAENNEDLVNLDDYLLDDDPVIDDNLLIGDTRAQSIINIEDDLNEIENIESTADSEFSPYFLELDQQEARPAAVFKELDDIGDNDDPEDEEGWAKKLLAEAEDEEEQDSAAIANKKQPPTPHPTDDNFENLFDTLEEEEEHQSTPLDPELLDILNDSEPSAVPQDEFILGDDMYDDEPTGDDDKHALLASIEPEPVELAAGPEGRRWRQRASLAGVIAALLLLGVQYLVFNFDRLARDHTYRPLLAKSCAVFGCSMPALHDLSLIRSSNLMVRSHPSKTGALVVDAIMTNHADFKQAFPVMELQFNDLDGRAVAGRRFTPQEYLAGELLGRSTMPTKQPIHIALEIVDPGDRAINYELRFHTPNPH